MVQGLEFRVQGIRFMVQGVGCMVPRGDRRAARESVCERECV